MKTRFLSLALLLVLCLTAALTGCGGTDTTTEPPQVTTPTADTILAKQLVDQNYSLIYPTRYTKVELECANQIDAALKQINGSMFPASDDHVKRNDPVPQNNKEILLGGTNRTSSQTAIAALKAARPNHSKDWQIIMKDQEVVIAAGDDEGLKLATTAFIALLKEKVSLSSYDSGVKTFSWALETIGGKPTHNYTIVIPENASTAVQNQASAVQQTLLNQSGSALEIVTDATAKAECEIVIGATNRPISATLLEKLEQRNNNHMDYAFSGSGTTLGVVSGKDDLTLPAAVNAFRDQLTSAIAQTVSLDQHYQAAGLRDITIDGVPAGDFQIVIAENASFALRYSAQRLRTYLLETAGYDVALVKDTAPATDHEILLGTTARPASATDLTKRQYNVTLTGGHLIFDAGHSSGIVQALDELIAAYDNDAPIALTPAYNSKKELAEDPKDGELGDGASAITFALFSDFHYKQNMYMSTMADMNAILDRAHENNAEFIIHAGDFCNDFLGSPELMKTYLENKYDLPAYGLYGNHELESAGNSMQVVTPLLNNRDVIWGTADGKIGDGSIAYYYYDVREFRIIVTDSNYSWNASKQIWEHNKTSSYGEPAGNSKANSLGPVQLKWLEQVLNQSADEGKKCIVMAHCGFSGEWSSSPDTAAVQAMYKAANEKKPGTVLMSINGHLHTNHAQVIDGVLYFDVNTVRNGYWTGNGTVHYTDQTFKYENYDSSGNLLGISDKNLSSLSQANNTYFFQDPLSCIVTVTSTGQILIEGQTTSWYGGIAPIGIPDGKMAEISSGMYDLNDN